MSTVATSVNIMALLGSAIIGGVFFAFSSFVMEALARVPPSQGIGAMQSINVVVLNRSFLGVFMGTAVLSIVVIALALLSPTQPSSVFMIGAALCYLFGTFLVTVIGNVPLNNRLKEASATDPSSISVWDLYLDRWVKWNHIRTVAAIAATLFFAMGLMQSAAA